MFNLQWLKSLWQQTFLNYTKIRQKISIFIPTLFGKTQFEVVVWRPFPAVTRSILHPFFYNGQFTITWAPLADKLLKSHQIESKNHKM